MVLSKYCIRLLCLRQLDLLSSPRMWRYLKLERKTLEGCRYSVLLRLDEHVPTMGWNITDITNSVESATLKILISTKLLCLRFIATDSSTLEFEWLKWLPTLTHSARDSPIPVKSPARFCEGKISCISQAFSNFPQNLKFTLKSLY